MSRTNRHYLGGKPRDGRQDFETVVARDNRATGVRDHQRERRIARATLKSGDDETLLNGKRRRYSDRYGEYML